MGQLPPVTFIVPTYGRATTLAATLQCALKQVYPNFEVIVASQDPVPPPVLLQLATAHPDRLHLLQLEHPNANAARNAAVRSARGEILLSIDDDVLFDSDYAMRHVARYEDKKTGFVMSLTRDWIDEPNETTLTTNARRFKTSAPLNNGDYVPIEWAATCAASFRRSALERAGWFDPYFTGGVADDTDVAVRIRAAGFTGYLDTTIVLTHLAASQGGYASREPNRSHTRKLNDQRMRMYFAWKNLRSIGICEVAKFYLSALRVTLRSSRDKQPLLGWFTAPFSFLSLAWKATRDGQKNRAPS